MKILQDEARFQSTAVISDRCPASGRWVSYVAEMPSPHTRWRRAHKGRVGGHSSAQKCFHFYFINKECYFALAIMSPFVATGLSSYFVVTFISRTQISFKVWSANWYTNYSYCQKVGPWRRARLTTVWKGKHLNEYVTPASPPSYKKYCHSIGK